MTGRFVYDASAIKLLTTRYDHPPHFACAVSEIFTLAPEARS
jgi:hypothetical protein